ncbi:MAG: hypothetical protein L3J24_02430 [Xanthomonadales bacterium]|nr:hypothetical protein [Xanthomonadales bacterium]
MENTIINWLSQALIILMFVGVVVIYGERLYSRRGVGARAIQITGVVLIIPLIGILSLHDILEKQTTATLIGALTGYLLSGVGSFEVTNKKENGSK